MVDLSYGSSAEFPSEILAKPTGSLSTVRDGGYYGPDLRNFCGQTRPWINRD